MNIGVCWFDETKVGGSGWCSIAGSQSRRITGINELESNVFWVTNLNYWEYRNLNLVRTPNIVDEQFFRSKLTVLAQEIGFNDTPDIICQKLSSILHGVHVLGIKSLGMSDNSLASYRYTNAMQSTLLKQEWRSQPRGNQASIIIEGIKQSTQENQAMTGKYVPKGSKATQFIFPRGTYAKWILSQKYPVNNNWRPLNFKENKETIIGYEDGVKIRGTEAVVDKLKNIAENSAGILKVSVLSTDDAYVNHSKFGAGANNMIRCWATIPEILEMSKYSKLSIMNGFHTEADKLDLPDILHSDQSEYSISKGLLLENAWVAISSPLYVKGYNNVSGIGAYMRAYDRIMCGRAAASFSRHGFVIGSYGTGRIVTYIKSGEENIAKELAFKNKLLPLMRFMSE